MDFAVPVDYEENIKKNEKGDKYFDPARELKNMEHEGDGDTNYNWCTQNKP